jgi:hypothetical protein
MVRDFHEDKGIERAGGCGTWVQWQAPTVNIKIYIAIDLMVSWHMEDPL